MINCTHLVVEDSGVISLFYKPPYEGSEDFDGFLKEFN